MQFPLSEIVLKTQFITSNNRNKSQNNYAECNKLVKTGELIIYLNSRKCKLPYSERKQINASL